MMRWRARLGILLLALITCGEAATIPRRAPEFVIEGPAGSVLLSQFRGKVVLLAFLFTT
jgi:hypothetical protein